MHYVGSFGFSFSFGGKLMPGCKALRMEQPMSTHTLRFMVEPYYGGQEDQIWSVIGVS